MKIRPLDDRVLVEPREEVYTGALIIPDAAKEKPIIGQVKAIGNDFDTEGTAPLSQLLKVGDIIIFGKYAGADIKLEGKGYLIISRSDILAVVEEE